jgi:4-amino-4-deoxy-L-arabinose transferase
VAAWAALGLGFLTKGPIILLWTAVPLLAWAAWTRSWPRAARLADPIGLGAFGLIALPWYLVEAARHPGLMEYWLRGQIAGRMVAPYRGEHEPWWTYGLTLTWAAWVWIVPAIAMLVHLAKERDRTAGRFLVAWVVAPLIAFSLFPTKRANYILPALPAIALAAGLWWDRAMEGLAPLRASIPRALAFGVAVFGLAFTIAAFFVEEVPRPITAVGWLFGPAFVLGGVTAWRAATRDRLDLAFTALLLPVLGLFLGLVAVLGHPQVETWSKISRPLIGEIAAQRPRGEPIVNYHVWLRALPFYLDERVITITEEGRVTAFEEDDIWRDYVFTADSSFFRMMAEPTPRLAVVRRTEVDDIENRLGRSVPVLARDSRYAVITNGYP